MRSAVLSSLFSEGYTEGCEGSARLCQLDYTEAQCYTHTENKLLPALKGTQEWVDDRHQIQRLQLKHQLLPL